MNEDSVGFLEFLYREKRDVLLKIKRHVAKTYEVYEVRYELAGPQRSRRIRDLCDPGVREEAGLRVAAPALHRRFREPTSFGGACFVHQSPPTPPAIRTRAQLVEQRGRTPATRGSGGQSARCAGRVDVRLRLLLRQVVVVELAEAPSNIAIRR